MQVAIRSHGSLGDILEVVYHTQILAKCQAMSLLMLECWLECGQSPGATLSNEWPDAKGSKEPKLWLEKEE